jgi:hypothetical protein
LVTVPWVLLFQIPGTILYGIYTMLSNSVKYKGNSIEEKVIIKEKETLGELRNYLRQLSGVTYFLRYKFNDLSRE